MQINKQVFPQVEGEKYASLEHFFQASLHPTPVKATYKTVKATYKTVKATYNTVKATHKTFKATHKTV